VELNRASEAELETLPGIGPALAGRIVAWRQQHGAFARLEDLASVPGIGPALLERLAPLVTVSGRAVR
jgi:competence protein ComEA